MEARRLIFQVQQTAGCRELLAAVASLQDGARKIVSKRDRLRAQPAGKRE